MFNKVKKVLLAATIVSVALVAGACGKNEKETTTEVTTEKIDYSAIPDITIDRATVSDAVWTNETLKISFPVSDNMQVLTDEELVRRMALDPSIFKDSSRFTITEFEDAMKGMAYDAMISIPDIKSAVSISYNNAKKSGVSDSSLDEYVDRTVETLTSQPSPKYTVKGIDDVTLGNIAYKRISLGTDAGMSQRMYIRREANYFVQMVVTYEETNDKWADEFEASFIEVK